MRYAAIVALVALALPGMSNSAEARKPCEELKAEIAAKLDAKGVQHYSLDIVDAAAVADQKVVGSCDGGSKRITYSRDSP
jgi:Protein of unknown function (DUF1161)